MTSTTLIRQVLWLVVWWFISFPVSTFCATFYILLNSIRACVPQVKDIVELLHKGVNFTGRASQGVVNGDSFDNLC